MKKGSVLGSIPVCLVGAPFDRGLLNRWHPSMATYGCEDAGGVDGGRQCLACAHSGAVRGGGMGCPCSACHMAR